MRYDPRVMAARVPFRLADLLAECASEVGVYALRDGDRPALGLRIHVPAALLRTYPYSGTAYGFLQQLRADIQTHGLIEFPGLPVNATNHTLAQRAPWEHGYSQNPFLTGFYQDLHQDTPPLPTAFWLDGPRRYFATWVTSREGMRRLREAQRGVPGRSLSELHAELVPTSVAEGWGALVNHQPGLLLLDNSDTCALYHARTARSEADGAAREAVPEPPSYAFNEVGLLQYIDTLDERRGEAHRSAEDRAQVIAFLSDEARKDRS